jgi:hypothetical protein
MTNNMKSGFFIMKMKNKGMDQSDTSLVKANCNPQDGYKSMALAQLGFQEKQKRGVWEVSEKSGNVFCIMELFWYDTKLITAEDLNRKDDPNMQYITPDGKDASPRKNIAVLSPSNEAFSKYCREKQDVNVTYYFVGEGTVFINDLWFDNIVYLQDCQMIPNFYDVESKTKQRLKSKQISKEEFINKWFRGSLEIDRLEIMHDLNRIRL